MPQPHERMEANITAWFKHQQEYETTLRVEKKRPFVTISRESGAYGTTVAVQLADYLFEHGHLRKAPWAVFDKELIQKVLEEHRVPTRFESLFAQSPTPVVRDILEELLGLHPAQETLIRRMSETILRLATAGYVILVGRGANIITRKLPNGTHVRLVGSLEKRIVYMKEFLSLNEKQAREHVTKEDHDRQAYIKRYFQKEISDVLLYDLIINTDTVPVREAVTIIGDAVLKTEMKRGA